ncbi:MAG: DUF1800 domain-containing protein [Candidatus Eiseniibacteriota bacterium]
MTGDAQAGFIAANRFGFGPRPGDLAAIGGAPRDWLLDQLARPAALPAELRDLPPGRQGAAEFLRVRRDGAEAIKTLAQTKFKAELFREINARTLAMIKSATPFRERLVAFWSNHFTVSASRFYVAPIAGGFEREAIRPHVTGKFVDMLLAVARHPAMLFYLDNISSIGPNSIAGRRTKRGLNENLAREIMELHTLGVDGGYTQEDVTSFARMLTGWSVDGVPPRGEPTGAFRFFALAHEPGDKTLLGKRYPEAGEDEAEAALRDLARHPSTARFIATKLVRHFVADDPPPTAVARIARVFTETDGDLGRVSAALINLDEAWAAPLPKMKSPYDFVVSAARAVGLTETPAPPNGFVASLHVLSQVPFTAPSPKGWPDTAADWLSPEALMHRIEWARAFAARLPDILRPKQLYADTIAPVATETTRSGIELAPSGVEGNAMILASVEFQRR